MRWQAAAILMFAAPALASPVTLPARAVRFQPEVHAWAEVEPLAPLVLRTTVAARVATVRVRPGEAVKAGEPLVTLAGPQFDAVLATAHARWQAAQHELAAAESTEASAKRTYPVVTNRAALDAAESALATARADLATAHAVFASLKSEQKLSSPVPARVSVVQAAPGTQLPAGSAVLTLLPDAARWLRVEWFGVPTPPLNATARFVPTAGGPVKVRLTAVLPARAPDGARVLSFTAVGSATWQAGDTGTLIWQAPPQNAVAVPAEALILNAGRWYVLTDAKGKLVARAVVPGPAHSTEVLITHGLAAGTPVVVRDAYLLFHRDFSAQYEPAD